MRRHDNVIELEQRIAGRHRLGVKHIEPRRAEVTRPERFEKCTLIHQAAASGVNQDGATAHDRKPLPVDQIGGGRGQRHMQRDDIGFAQKLG